MIGFLTGTYLGERDNAVLIDVNGVGYLVEVTSSFLVQAPQKGEVVSLSIETYVREDQFRLFGFFSDEERQWFKLLMGVQGVGAKVALAVLGILSPSALAESIAAQDKAAIARTPGVGPKVAQRVVQELKDKAPAPQFNVPDGAVSIASGALDDALSALVNLGYQRNAAYMALQHLRNENADLDMQGLIKGALRELSQ